MEYCYITRQAIYNNTMQFLKKYRFTILLMIVLTVISFWYNPRQENLYLKSDYELLEKKSAKALLWAMGAGIIIILAFAIKDVKKTGEAANVLFGVVALSLPVCLIFKTVFLFVFLALNRIELNDHFEKKYVVSFFIQPDKQTPLIYDFRTKKTFFPDNVRQAERLNDLKTGDTVVLSFRKGLLGTAFKPVIK